MSLLTPHLSTGVLNNERKESKSLITERIITEILGKIYTSGMLLFSILITVQIFH